LIHRDTCDSDNYTDRNNELALRLQGAWAAKKIKMIERFPADHSTAWRAIQE
jgi:hypothetical protein